MVSVRRNWHLLLAGVLVAFSLVATLADRGTLPGAGPGLSPSFGDPSLSPGQTGSANLKLQMTGTITGAGRVRLNADITNQGPNTASNLHLTIAVAPSMTYIPATNVPCSQSAQGASVTCTFNSVIPSGGTQGASLYFSYGDCWKGAGTASGEPSDPNLADNSVTVTSYGGCPPAQPADLELRDPFITPDSIQPGQLFTLTMPIRNLGPGTAENVRARGNLPPGIALGLNNPGCSLQIATHFDCTLGDLAEGASINKVIHLQTSDIPCASTYAFNLRAIALLGLMESTLTNNDKILPIDVTNCGTASAIDLGIPSVTLYPPALHEGENGTVTVTVKNTGPGATQQAEVRLKAPAGFQFITANGCLISVPKDEVLCELGVIAANAQVQRQAVVRKVDTSCGSASVAVSVKDKGNTTDANAANDTSSLPLPCPIDKTDLRLEMTPSGIQSITQGGQVPLTLRVTNAGPNDAYAVFLESHTAPDVAFVTGSFPAICTRTVTAQNAYVRCNFGLIRVGETKEISMIAAVDYTVACGQVRPITFATSASQDTTLPDGQKTLELRVCAASSSSASAAEQVNLRLSTVGGPPGTVGPDNSIAIIVVQNYGPAPARNPFVQVTLPADAVLGAGQTPCIGNPPVLICPLPTLESMGTVAQTSTSFSLPLHYTHCVHGNSYRILLRARATPPQIDRDLTNNDLEITQTLHCPSSSSTASVSSAPAASSPSSRSSAQGSMPSGAQADLVLSNLPQPITRVYLESQAMELTFTVTNAGPGPASIVDARITVPPEITLDVARGAPLGCRMGGQEIFCPIAPGLFSSQHIDVRVPIQVVRGTYCPLSKLLTVSVQSYAHDPLPENNTASRVLNVTECHWIGDGGGGSCQDCQRCGEGLFNLCDEAECELSSPFCIFNGSIFGGTCSQNELLCTVGAVCNDDVDNDGDGRIDFPHDPGCTTFDDGSEDNPPPSACSDQQDNDGDSLIDFPQDPGCSGWVDTDETNAPPPPPPAACSDEWDNDGDSLIDYPADAGCSDPADTDETNAAPIRACNDGQDNDQDGAIDFPADFSCANANDNDERLEKPDCQDGKDNDEDLRTDFPQDPGCSSTQDNDETGSAEPRADFAIGLTVGSGEPGRWIDIIAAVGNGGPVAAGGRYVITPPPGFTFDAYNRALCTLDGASLSCLTGFVPVGSSVSQRISVRIPANAGCISIASFTASVNPLDLPDPHPENNTASAQRQLQCIEVLGLKKEPTLPLPARLLVPGTPQPQAFALRVDTPDGKAVYINSMKIHFAYLPNTLPRLTSLSVVKNGLPIGTYPIDGQRDYVTIRDVAVFDGDLIDITPTLATDVNATPAPPSRLTYSFKDDDVFARVIGPPAYGIPTRVERDPGTFGIVSKIHQLAWSVLGIEKTGGLSGSGPVRTLASLRLRAEVPGSGGPVSLNRLLLTIEGGQVSDVSLYAEHAPPIYPYIACSPRSDIAELDCRRGAEERSFIVEPGGELAVTVFGRVLSGVPNVVIKNLSNPDAPILTFRDFLQPSGGHIEWSYPQPSRTRFFWVNDPVSGELR